ncbi:methyl-accepting chemotaxis protein [Wenxinia saemankumensis]|uniref:Methyl-accepting chemotaxis protein n=1 Tax=Wenxinia saemankumensis TaxID=1447782 RepID=A0A1M6GXS4_9RHOB|nr:methyl-accepting chemotaxis protein [Wenxinia saemankumensis]SHJ14759.1 Methyl-accepting chemotaxis protein [Wenxinia saemankumensis]
MSRSIRAQFLILSGCLLLAAAGLVVGQVAPGAIGAAGAAISGGALALGLGLGALVHRQITDLLTAMGASVARQAAGQPIGRVPGSDRADCFGDLARGLEVLGPPRAEEGPAPAPAQDLLLAELRGTLDRVAAGDLTARIDPARRDRLDAASAALCTALDDIVAGFSDLVAGARQSGESLGRGAEEVARISRQLSRRTEAQAATVEQSAAALDELTASVRAAAASAEEADHFVAENREAADLGGRVVAEAVTAMAAIEKTSAEVVKIITVIDDIAFQTNLLALNAGVEAARAGESGRGFAVVASEVRALAQRAGESAGRIRDLISMSNTQIKEGSALVSRTGTALEGIVGNVAEVAQRMNQIATSAREQAQGLQEINLGVMEIDKATQQNASIVEETERAAATISDGAAALERSLDRYRVPAMTARPLPLSVVSAPDAARPNAASARRPTGPATRPDPADARRIPAAAHPAPVKLRPGATAAQADPRPIQSGGRASPGASRDRAPAARSDTGSGAAASRSPARAATSGAPRAPAATAIPAAHPLAAPTRTTRAVHEKADEKWEDF